MIKEAIQHIQEITRPVIVRDHEDREYSTVNIEPILDQTPAPITLHTLTGLSDYLKTNRDDLNFKFLIVHVETPFFVNVASSLTGDFNQRYNYLFAKHEDRSKRFFGQWWDVEQFIISMQTLFELTEPVKYILQYASGLTESSSRDLKDDGITQKTTIRRGLSAIVEEADIVNPVRLKPFRTFPEIDQVESPFVFRLRPGKNAEGLPECTLLEADGGTWELEAVHRIRDWLKENLPPEIAIIA